MPEKITQLHVKTDWLEINTTSIRFGPTKSEEGEQVYGRRYDASSNTEVGNWCLLPLFVNDGQVSKGIKTVLVGANGQMLSIPCNQIAPEGRDTTAILFLEDEKLSKKIEELTVEATSLQEQISRTAARLEAHQKEQKKLQEQEQQQSELQEYKQSQEQLHQTLQEQKQLEEQLYNHVQGQLQELQRQKTGVFFYASPQGRQLAEEFITKYGSVSHFFESKRFQAASSLSLLFPSTLIDIAIESIDHYYQQHRKEQGSGDPEIVIWKLHQKDNNDAYQSIGRTLPDTYKNHAPQTLYAVFFPNTLHLSDLRVKFSDLWRIHKSLNASNNLISFEVTKEWLSENTIPLNYRRLRRAEQGQQVSKVYGYELKDAMRTLKEKSHLFLVEGHIVRAVENLPVVYTAGNGRTITIPHSGPVAMKGKNLEKFAVEKVYLLADNTHPNCHSGLIFSGSEEEIIQNFLSQYPTPTDFIYSKFYRNNSEIMLFVDDDSLWDELGDKIWDISRWLLFDAPLQEDGKIIKSARGNDVYAIEFPKEMTLQQIKASFPRIFANYLALTQRQSVPIQEELPKTSDNPFYFWRTFTEWGKNMLNSPVHEERTPLLPS
ncbi:hypothetical protein [Legionella maceachernii]|uniref:Fatty acid metabolism regulator protein n=1 Tax=Legionella maceachernii TaxID=466 RepID=A0A0W0WCC4_9GAMM|nr:hypothetical protein [Legionella maceachernii]KTD29891.1 Fatty acid metabolism regulator protein [Legionella maceachernii]SJZ45155.1 hypothetical protein SAMN02745128_00050 [Legionella maceachernii]SUP04106.1 Uncharacterized conserved protein containing a coiled-coil domain [Legionella maceachernii]